jgi:hypothetical protein
MKRSGRRKDRQKDRRKDQLADNGVRLDAGRYRAGPEQDAVAVKYAQRIAYVRKRSDLAEAGYPEAVEGGRADGCVVAEKAGPKTGRIERKPAWLNPYDG